MAARYKPSPGDVDIIKRAAAREGDISIGAVVLEPGWRYNTQRDTDSSMNIARVSDDPQWNDTDLADYGTWAEFRRGVELTDDGRAIVDFYIRKRGDEYRDLLGNVTIEVRAGKLVRVHGYGNKSDYFNAED